MVRNRLFYVYATLLFLLAAAVIYFNTYRDGIGLTADSFSYLFGAKSLAGGDGYVWYDGNVITLFPPFYSLMLSVWFYMLNDIDSIARYMNIFLYGSLAFLTANILYQGTKSHFHTILGSICIITFPSLVSWASIALSDILFINLFLLYLLTIIQYTEKKLSRYLYIASIILSCCMTTRYIGICWLPVSVIVVTVSYNASMKYRIFHNILTTVISVTPLFLFILRNQLGAGRLAGARSFGERHLLENIQTGIETISKILGPLETNQAAQVALMLALIFFSFLSFYLLIIYCKNGPLNVLKKNQLFITVFALGTFLYFIFLLTITTVVSSIVPIGSHRYLLPLVVCGFILFILILNSDMFESNKQLSRYRNIYKLVSKHTGVSAILLFTIFQSYNTILDVTYAYRNGFPESNTNFRSAVWMNSKTFTDLAYILKESSVFTNYSAFIYFHYGFKAKSISSLMEKNIKFMDNTYLVYFLNGYRKEKYSIDSIKDKYVLKEISINNDGNIFKIISKN